jgi:hypothetical protein
MINAPCELDKIVTSHSDLVVERRSVKVAHLAKAKILREFQISLQSQYCCYSPQIILVPIQEKVDCQPFRPASGNGWP